MNKHFGAHSNKSIRNATNEEVAEAVVENIFGGQTNQHELLYYYCVYCNNSSRQ